MANPNGMIPDFHAILCICRSKYILCLKQASEDDLSEDGVHVGRRFRSPMTFCLVKERSYKSSW